MINIAKIMSVETYSIRISVLRHGKKMEVCPFDGDNLATTAHFGMYFDAALVGIVSVFKLNNPAFAILNQFQIRGMAVLDNYQHQGFGKLLIESAENHVKLLNANLIWMNARKNAVPFYLKLGYVTSGDSFIIDGIGIHFLMIKYK